MHKTSTSFTNYCFLFCSLSLFRLLLDLAQRFAEDGSTMEQFGLPKPQGVDTEVDRRLVKAKMPSYLEELQYDGKLNDLLVYFDRRDSESEVVFTKFFDEWDYNYEAPK